MPSGAPRRLHLETAGRLLLGLALGLVVGALLLVLRPTDLVSGLELRALDVRLQHFAGERPPDPRIVLAQVEEEDILALKRDRAIPWPWPLSTNAAMFRVLADAGARAVLVDTFHADKGAGPEDLVGGRELNEEERLLQTGEVAQAEEYGEALAALPSVAVALLTDAPSYDAPARHEAAASTLDAAGLTAPGSAHARAAIDLPISRVGRNVKRLGFATVVPDLDGIVRRAHVVARAGERTVLSAPLATALLVEGGTPRLEERALRLGDRRLPLDPDASFVVDYRSRHRGAYARVSPAQLLRWDDRRAQGALPAEARAALEGKLVVWGVNAQGLQDLAPTPIDPFLDGPEFQALVLDNLLNGGGRVHAPPALAAAWLLGLCGLAGLVAFGPKRKSLPHLLSAALAVATVVVAFAVFKEGPILDLFTPLLGILLAWAGGTALKLVTEGRYNRWLEGTFSRYLAPSVIDALKQDPRLLELGGVEREVTVLFSDIAHFTTHSERLSATQLVTLLNRYLTPHCDAVFAHGGVVDKFIGDAVMAFFGDPIPQPDHALRACRTALDVRAALPALEPVWRGMGLPDFEVRIGLNSGRARLGNMGSEQRFSYTAMGDTVNLASRLEGANKAFGTKILLGERTHEAVKDAVLAKPLARLTVVGKDEPIAVAELLALRERATPEEVRHVESFARAQEAARAGDLAGARRHLAEAAALRPGDGPCAWFATVLDGLSQGPEPRAWTGLVTLSSK